MNRQVASLPGDRILLRGLVFYGYHGVNPEEQKLGQRFRVDITLWADPQPAGV
jgi:dihydroneopterin aldolase